MQALRLHGPRMAHGFGVAVVPAYSIPRTGLDLKIASLLLRLGVHDEQRTLGRFRKAPNAWRNWNLAHGDGGLHAAPALSPAVGLEDVPVHVALAADWPMASVSAKGNGQDGDGEKDCCDAWESVHGAREAPERWEVNQEKPERRPSPTPA